jgi:hypothetical protein
MGSNYLIRSSGNQYNEEKKTYRATRLRATVPTLGAVANLGSCWFYDPTTRNIVPRLLPGKWATGTNP